ncbi:AAA family ATPase [Methylobacter psychrophilus]|uniref:AAA family ATPase n=1 Tax=Methylobacter psychrophilus TaxID=96941 RepID=UPI0021D49EF0|nr:AAA family ATPase [Methylobacter psychrophilus]
MRILAIRGKNLASLAEPFEILLDEGPLQPAGLFAITGATGAGKSTILDALCLALYDKMPRLPDGHGFAVGHRDEDESLRVNSTDVRSILRRGTSTAYAEVDFIGKDKHHYRARWEVSKARGKANGRLQAQEVILSKIDSGQRIGQGKRNTLEAISELIDLNFDQFRRSVLLAQGDFAAFLKAKKDERSSLLERITGTDIYSELSIEAFERARTEKEALNRITGLMQNQLPLEREARLILEQQRDQFSQQLIELDLQISGNQKIIDWYVLLKKYRQAQQLAIDVHATQQQHWNSAEADRLLIQKIEAVQPLRPLLSHYKTANDDYLAAEKTLNNTSQLQITAESSLQTIKAQLTLLFDQLQVAEQQQQQAQPLLKKVRDLDTRLDVVENAINTLTAEELQLNKALQTARQQHQSLLKQQAEKATTLAQLTAWLEQNQALKPIAAEWNRWEGELERYQRLNAEKTTEALQAQNLKGLAHKNELALASLKIAIDENRQQQKQQLTKLEQLKGQGSEQSLEVLYQQKETLEDSVLLLNSALGLATQALELQQGIKQDTENLIATEQLISSVTEQLQTVTGQQHSNELVLEEAKKALDLIQASTHKNAGQFRQLLIKDQPCPVCGALEHPWKDQDSIDSNLSPSSEFGTIAAFFNEQITAQSGRVKELQSLKETFIKSSAELNKTLVHERETQQLYATSLPQAQVKLELLGNEWRALDFTDKPDDLLTDAALLPLLNTHNEKLLSALVLIKAQEKTALELQKQIKTAQESFDTTKLKTENLANDYTGLDKQLAKYKADLDHISTTILQQEKQLQAIIELLQVPFAQLENWRGYLQSSFTELTEKVQKFQQTELALASETTALLDINQDEKLIAQTLTQCLQYYQDKQTETKGKSQEKLALSTQRDGLLPKDASGAGLSADSFEQTINQALLNAKAAHQQAGNTSMQLEKELASLQQQQQHWQLEATRRQNNRETALTTLNAALEKHSITVEQLTELLKHDEAWLTEQKTKMQVLEQALQESTTLLKIKAEDCRQHESQAVEITEEIANQTAAELQLQQQNLGSQKEEQVLLLREDDKKIAASSHLKVELETQQNCWQQWESLNELIGSSNGAKFRVFAQSLTLEALLAHSNQHLEDFAKRYHLQRVPGSDLELQIIDRDMADDVRSVHSLSGGESFLVSLALALGLASLSSNRTQVESLFIDEGFGSLDPETLDIAIASLDTLQALGRKVGIISHVPILVERIGAKVVVEKQGGGRSSVVVVGGY